MFASAALLLPLRVASADGAPSPSLPPGPSSAADGAREVPSEPGVAALLFDLRRIVDAEEGSGWLLDEAAHANVHPALMESVCRSTIGVRAEALARARREAERLGDPEALYRVAGEEMTSEVTEALSAARRARAMQRAVDAAPGCPFWVRRDPEFRGLQSTRERFIVNFDTGGTVQVRRSAGEWTVGAGGFGRLLAGYSFTDVSLLAGLEFGGGALLEPNTQPPDFVINYMPALPLIVRLHREAWNLDLEGAAVGLFQPGNLGLSYGARGGVTVGYSSLRLRGVLPWIGLGIAAERHFGSSARPGATYFRGGLRVGGVWAP